jgi:hypothetical protein
MAKLSDLVLRSSEITGVPLPTVREISRRLRENHLIQTGVGGRYGGLTVERPASCSKVMGARTGSFPISRPRSPTATPPSIMPTRKPDPLAHRGISTPQSVSHGRKWPQRIVHSARAPIDGAHATRDPGRAFERLARAVRLLSLWLFRLLG